jgi:hypothetical protein
MPLPGSRKASSSWTVAQGLKLRSALRKLAIASAAMERPLLRWERAERRSALSPRRLSVNSGITAFVDALQDLGFLLLLGTNGLK